jgi:hypothetical protein
MDSLLLDPIYDLTNSTGALLSSIPNTDTAISFDVPVNDRSSLGFYKDTDSISTFRSIARSALKKKKNQLSTPPTTPSTPTPSVSFAPAFLMKPDDTSVSRMSDTASKVEGLENRLEQMESHFTSSFARLEAILAGLGSHRQAVTSTGSSKTPVTTSANHPTPDTAGGSTHNRAAGQG